MLSPAKGSEHGAGTGRREDPLLFALLAKLFPGDGYHEPSARDARRRIISFFDDPLKDERPN